ncbi:MAG: DUF5372 family protein, partial [Solirubrobacteraceae bacterium]
MSSDPSGFVIVTHPFHPLHGQRLEILYAKRRGAEKNETGTGLAGMPTRRLLSRRRALAARLG